MSFKECLLHTANSILYWVEPWDKHRSKPLSFIHTRCIWTQNMHIVQIYNNMLLYVGSLDFPVQSSYFVRSAVAVFQTVSCYFVCVEWNPDAIMMVLILAAHNIFPITVLKLVTSSEISCMSQHLFRDLYQVDKMLSKVLYSPLSKCIQPSVVVPWSDCLSQTWRWLGWFCLS